MSVKKKKQIAVKLVAGDNLHVGDVIVARKGGSIDPEDTVSEIVGIWRLRSLQRAGRGTDDDTYFGYLGLTWDWARGTYADVQYNKIRIERKRLYLVVCDDDLWGDVVLEDPRD